MTTAFEISILISFVAICVNAFCDKIPFKYVNFFYIMCFIGIAYNHDISDFILLPLFVMAYLEVRRNHKKKSQISG